MNTYRATVQSSDLGHGPHLAPRKSLFEAVCEVDTPDIWVRAIDQAVAHIGFPIVQVMLAAPLPKPKALAMSHQSENLIPFDRAISAASELSSPYDSGLGDPVRDPVLGRNRRVPLPMMTDRGSYVGAGMADAGDWILEHDRGQVLALQRMDCSSKADAIRRARANGWL